MQHARKKARKKPFLIDAHGRGLSRASHRLHARRRLKASRRPKLRRDGRF